MHATKIILAIIAAVLAIIGNIAYFRDVLRGRIKPHPYTWLIWSIVSCVTFFGQLQKGAVIGALPTGVAEAFTILIFIFSLKYLFKGNAGHIKKTDTIFLIIALAGLIPWALTRDPTISVIIVVSIDAIAFIPALRKTWSHPRTEKPALYEMNVARHVLSLFSLNAYNVVTTLHSIVMICTNATMTIFIKRKKNNI